MELKKLVVLQGYTIPRLGALTTMEKQQHELEVLKEATVAAQRSYVEEKKRIKTISTSLSPRRINRHRHNSNFLSSNNLTSFPPPTVSVLYYWPGSNAEQTIFPSTWD